MVEDHGLDGLRLVIRRHHDRQEINHGGRRRRRHVAYRDLRRYAERLSKIEANSSSILPRAFSGYASAKCLIHGWQICDSRLASKETCEITSPRVPFTTPPAGTSPWACEPAVMKTPRRSTVPGMTRQDTQTTTPSSIVTGLAM